jgi:hypothetical protein
MKYSKKQVKMGKKEEAIHSHLGKKDMLKVIHQHLKETKNYYSKLRKCKL